MSAAIVAGLAFDGHCILREYRRGEEKRAVMFAAVEAMAKPDAVRRACCRDPNIAAQAASGNLLHTAPPSFRVGAHLHDDRIFATAQTLD